MKSTKRSSILYPTLIGAAAIWILISIAVLAANRLAPVSQEISLEREGIVPILFSDRETGGNSVVEFRSSQPNEFSFAYTLGDKVRHPYAGATLSIIDTTHFIDLSKMDQIVLKVNSEKSDSIRVTVQFHIPGLTLFDNGMTQYYLSTDLAIESGNDEYRIDFSDLQTPDWWFNENNLHRSTFPAPDLKRCTGISFSNHSTAQRSNEYTFSLEKVTFVGKSFSYSLFSGIFGIGLLFITAPLLFTKRKKEIYRPCRSGVSREVDNELLENEELRRLVSYLNSNYHRFDLNQPMTVKETNLKVATIRDLLKRHFGKSFRQYITDIRLAEGKRLILENNYKISTIAKTIGYPHVSTFNHHFKSSTGISPKEFKRGYDQRTFRKRVQFRRRNSAILLPLREWFSLS